MLNSTLSPVCTGLYAHVMMMLVTAAANAGNENLFEDERCVTSVLSTDTIRCSCADVTGYIAVLAPRVYVSTSKVK